MSRGQIKGTMQMENLCWYCRHAVPRMNRNGKYICGCEWSRYRMPVKGWEAEMTFKTGAGPAWAVYFCPKYINDTLPDTAPWHGTTTAGAHNLAEHNWKNHGVDIFPNADPWGDKNTRKVEAHWRLEDRTPEERELAEDRRKEQNRKAYQKYAETHQDVIKERKRRLYREKHPEAKRTRKQTSEEQREKRKAYQREYHEKHKAEINAKNREKYRATHPKKTPKTRHESYEEHKEARRAYQREYYRKHKAAIAEKHREHYRQNAEAIGKKRHEYYMAHKDYYKTKCKEYRDIEKGLKQNESL